jgi:hypothetical protein
MAATRPWIVAATLLSALAATSGSAQLAPAVSSAPGCGSAQHRQFDFWVGRWDVYPTGQDKAVARSLIENLYGGCVIRENWMPLSGTPGGSLNTYDPEDGKWHQVWMDAGNARVSFVGEYVGDRMILTGFWKGAEGPRKDGLVRMTYTRIDGGGVRQLGEISKDQGATWKPFFDFTYRPVAVPK